MSPRIGTTNTSATNCVHGRSLRRTCGQCPTVGCLTCGDHGCSDCDPTLFRGPSRRDDQGFHPQEECWGCGYVLELHTTPRSDLGGWPDRNGGCPESEVAAAMRWGWM